MNKQRRRLSWFAYLLLLLALGFSAGCAHYEASPLNAEKSAAEFQSRNLDSNELAQFIYEHSSDNSTNDWPLQSWDLDTLTLAGFFFHPDLKLALAQGEVAEARIKTAAMRPNPSLNIRPSYSTANAIPTPWIAATDLNIPIETAGKRGFRIAQAEHLSTSAQLNVAATAWRIRGEVRQAFLEFWTATKLSEAHIDHFETQQQIVHFLESRFKAGDISQIEVSREKVILESAHMASLSAQNRITLARTRLAGAIGTPIEALDKISFNFGLFEEAPIQLPEKSLLQAALLNRTDILAGLASYAAAESALRLEIARQYPNITLSPGHNYNKGDSEWRLALLFDLPILNRNQGPIAEAEARRKERAALFNQLQTSVRFEIANAVASYNAAIAVSHAARRTLEAAENQEQLTKQSYDAGESSLLDVSSARKSRNLGLVTFVEAQSNAHLSLAQLEFATQISLENTQWESSIYHLSHRNE